MWMTLAQAGATLDQQGLGALAPFFAADFGLVPAALGSVYGAIYLGSALFTVPSGLLVDRSGERRVILWTGVLMGLALAAAAAIANVAWLSACLFVFGAAYAASSPAGGRAILRSFREQRGLAMGIRQAGAPLGSAVGVLLLPAVALHAGYRGALLVGGVLCAVTSVLAALRYRTPGSSTSDSPQPPGARRSLWALVGELLGIVRLRRTMLLNLTGFVLGAGQYTAVVFVAVTLLHAGTSLGLATAALAIMNGTAVAARPVWGLLSDRPFRGDRTLPLALLCALAAGSAWGFGSLVRDGVSLFGVIVVSVGLGASVVAFTGLFNTVLAEIGGTGSAGSVMGVGLTFNYGAGFVMPPLFGALLQARGFSFAWHAIAVFLACGGIAAFAARERPARPV
jgi:ACS family hexuronate transporter-like MFS transporter